MPLRNRVFLLALLLLGCGTSAHDPGVSVAGLAAREAESVTGDESVAVAPMVERCEERIAEAALAPLTERTEAYIAQLPEVVVEARVSPVFYLAWPSPTEDLAVEEARTAIRESDRPARAIRDLVSARARDRAFLRAVLLRDGYLFEERPVVARALSAEVDLETLFDGPTVYRARGGQIELLTLGEDGYVAPDGERATLRLNDRVAESLDALEHPLNLDLAVIRERSGAIRTVPTAASSDRASFDLTFPDGTQRPSLVALEDGETRVLCVGGDPSTLAATRANAQEFWARHRTTEEAARRLVEERVRFDEPVNEPEGVQEDGALRRAWRNAYLAGDDRFTYREVEYRVFDGAGNPTPPEVCVDFVFDSWERGSGAWYRPRGEAPGRFRSPGSVDLAGIDALPRRNIGQLLEFVEAGETPIERFDVPAAERVPLREGASFAQAIARLDGAFREGDALIIHGLRQQDMRVHYHAVLVLETEPMTGVPAVVADNQGRAQVRSLAGALRAAPLRSVKHRLRLAPIAFSTESSGVAGSAG